MDTSVTIFSLGYIIILIVPGIIFKRFFFQDAFSGQFNSGLFADRLVTSLFWGILVQIISALTFSRIINVTYTDWKNMVQRFYKSIADDKLPDITDASVSLSIGAKIVNFAVLTIMLLASNQILKIVPGLAFVAGKKEYSVFGN